MGTLSVVDALASVAINFDMPDSDAERIEAGILLTLVLCAVAAVVVVRTVAKASVRILTLLLLLAVGIGLWTQREQIDDCRGQCECHVFGLDIDMGDVPGVDCRG